MISSFEPACTALKICYENYIYVRTYFQEHQLSSLGNSASTEAATFPSSLLEIPAPALVL